MSVPLMLIPIFVFQFLTTYYFFMSIVGLAMVIIGYLWLVQLEDVEGAGSICMACIMSTGGGRRRIVAATFQACGWLLFIAGVVAELLVDDARVGNLLHFDALTIVSRVSAFLLSMHLSQATTLSLAIRASNYFFSGLHNVGYIAPEHRESALALEHGMAVEPSQLTDITNFHELCRKEDSVRRRPAKVKQPPHHAQEPGMALVPNGARESAAV